MALRLKLRSARDDSCTGTAVKDAVMPGGLQQVEPGFLADPLRAHTAACRPDGPCALSFMALFKHTQAPCSVQTGMHMTDPTAARPGAPGGSPGADRRTDAGGRPQGSPLEVLWVFLKLGVSSFGGPVAHIGYFRSELVVRRRWVDEPVFADLVGLCQFLPGPASSQLGFALGLLRAGYRGALAAWTGFTLPSAVLLVLFAYGAHALSGPTGRALLHGLALVAVAIIAQAVWGMARTLCPDRQRASIAVLAALIVLGSASSGAQIAAIATGGILGLAACRTGPATAPLPIAVPVSPTVGTAALALFFILLLGLPLLAALDRSSAVALFEGFYRSGALVFGGGHVVLPLLREAFVAPGWVSDEAFLSGYGAAQAVPGPLFTFAAYLGAVVRVEPHGLPGAALGLIGIFLPGLLILLGTLPFWESVRHRVTAQRALRGVNAAVVGVLGAALYHPVWTSSVRTPADFAVVLVGFVLLTAWAAPPLLVVIVSATGGLLLAQAP